MMVVAVRPVAGRFTVWRVQVLAWLKPARGVALKLTPPLVLTSTFNESLPEVLM